MSTKHITDLQVLEAYKLYAEYSKFPQHYPKGYFPYVILQEMTGQCEKVCYRAMERAADRDLIEYGVSLRTGWLTEKGEKLLKEKG